MNMTPTEFTCKTVAIVKFGPAGFETDGITPAQYYQVTIDPDKVSGDYIRFGGHPGDEILGWQRIAALTVVHVLGEWSGETPETFNARIGAPSVTFRVLESD